MKQSMIIVSILTCIVLAACTSPPVEVTRIVATDIEVTRLVEAEVEVTRLVEVEVTRLVEVPMEVTRIVVSGDANGVNTVEDSAAPNGVLNIGEEGKDGNLVFLAKEWNETDSIITDRGEMVFPPEGGKFVVVRVDILNDGFESVDIYCSRDMVAVLIDDRGREFDDTGRSDIVKLYHIENNAGCNDQLQPGFRYEDQTLAFMLPTDAIPAYIKLWDPNEPPQRGGSFRDAFGEDSSVNYKLEP